MSGLHLLLSSRWMWFSYGMLIFSFTWLKIISLVQVRFLQYFSKKEKGVADEHMTHSMKRVSMATKSGLRDKNVRNPLSTALGTYFCIWMVYPLLWLLREVTHTHTGTRAHTQAHTDTDTGAHRHRHADTFCFWTVYPLLWLLREVGLYIGSVRLSAHTPLPCCGCSPRIAYSK